MTNNGDATTKLNILSSSAVPDGLWTITTNLKLKDSNQFPIGLALIRYTYTLIYNHICMDKTLLKWRYPTIAMQLHRKQGVFSVEGPPITLVIMAK